MSRFYRGRNLTLGEASATPATAEGFALAENHSPRVEGQIPHGNLEHLFGLHAHDAPRVADPDDIDVCAYLFERCKEWQHAFLDRAGLTCLFDVDAGHLPEQMCKTLESIAHMRLQRLADIAEPPGGTTTVMLRHRGPMWALAISDRYVRYPGPRLAREEINSLRTLAQRLEGAYMIQPSKDGTVVAVMFSDQPGVLSPAALADGRAQFRH